MSAKHDNAALQHWDCDRCPQTYASPVALTWPPQHRCGGVLARTLRDFKLKTVKAPKTATGFLAFPKVTT